MKNTTYAVIFLFLTCAAEGVSAPLEELALAPSTTQVITRQQRPPVSDREIECLALTIYHEARGLSPRGREAVAHVVLNRATDSGRTICAVVYEGGRRPQFQWTARSPRTVQPRERQAWADARDMARNMIVQRPHDFTGGATHFFNPAIVGTPGWARNPEHRLRVEAHVFVRPRGGHTPVVANDNRRTVVANDNRRTVVADQRAQQ